MLTKPYQIGFGVSTLAAFAALVIFIFFSSVNFDQEKWLYISLASWTVLSVFFLALSFNYSKIGVLVGGFCVLAALRITGIHDIWSMNILLWIALFGVLFAFLCLIREEKADRWENALTFMRLYIGFDLMGHATEKLFAGPEPFMGDVQAFINLHVPYPEAFVAVAGVCEFAGAIAIAFGFLTRLGAICTALYLLIATLLGSHFSLGFIWANPGGGWEYPLEWIVFTLVFAVTGAGYFSIDKLLVQYYSLPKWFYCISGQRALP